MFDKKYYTTKVVNDFSEVSKQLELDRISRERIAEKEMRVRDRVDISLVEYEELKKYKSLSKHFGKFSNLNIVPDTMDIFYSESFLHNDFRPRLRCAIYFDFIPEEGMKLEDYIEAE